MTLTLFTVFGAGLLTLLTPCILPMLPVYLTLLVGSGLRAAHQPRSRRELLLATVAFIGGFGIVFTLLGLAASTAGTFLQAHRGTLVVVGGLFIVAFGAKFLGILRLPWLERTVQLPALKTASPPLNALALGTVFALGWTPCVGPILGTVLTLAATTSESPWQGALLLATYSLGVGLPLLVVAAAAERVLPNLRRLHRHLPRIERLAGMAMVLVGLALALPPVVQHWAAAAPVDGNEAHGPAQAARVAIGARSPLPRLVEFYSDSCPVCERVAPAVDRLRRDCVGHRVEVLQVNVSDPGGARVAARYGVHAVPTFVLLRASGETESVLFGERGLGKLRAAAARLIDAPCAGAAPGEPLQTGSQGCALKLGDAPSNAWECSADG